MEEKEHEAAVRVRLVFADRHLLTKEQRSQGFNRSWAAIHRELATVADFARDIISRFGLGLSSIHGLVFSMDGFTLPSFESTSIFRDNDIIRVKRKIDKDKKAAVAFPNEELQIEGNESINNGTLLLENGENTSQKKKSKKKKKKKKRVLTEVTCNKRKHKEMEGPEDSKNKKLKLAANERPVITTERNCSVLAIQTPCQHHTFNQEANAPCVASKRNKEVTCTSQNTSSEHQHGQEFHNRDVILKEQKSMMLHNFKDKFIETKEDFHGAIHGNGTGSLPNHIMCCQIHSLCSGAGLSNEHDNWPRTCWHRSNLDDPDAPNPRSMWKSRSQSDDGQNERNSQLGISNSVSSDEEEESDEEDDIDFEGLYPLTCLPTEGDVIAYRLVETSSGRPELSVFRAGKVIKFDPITMLILLGPVPRYPIFPDGEISESQKSMYKEDGTLEIDFGSLVDLRLVEESESGKGCSKSKVITWENGIGCHSGGFNNNIDSAWKAAEASNAKKETKTGWGTTWTPGICRDSASWQGMGQRRSKIQSHSGSRGRNGGMRRNMNSAWQAGEASHATEVTKYGRGTWAMNNSRYSAPNPRRGGNGNRFGLYGSFSRRMNDRAGNNDNSAWEANREVTNANEQTQTQENGWDTWAPNTSRASASWSHMGQNSSGLRSGGGFPRVTRRDRGGRFSNPKFRK